MNVDMKRCLPFLLLALALLLVTIPMSGSSSADPAGTTYLEGTVMHSPSGTPLPFANATVLAMDNGTEVASNVTGSDGSYNLSVPDGTFEITVVAEGYRMFQPSNTSVTVSGQVVIDLDVLFNSRIFLEPVYTNVSGVISNNGDGIAGAQVYVLHNGTTLANTTSNSTGYYSLTVRSGNHTLRVVADGYIENEQAIDAPASGALTVDVLMLPLSSYSLQGTVTIVQGPLASSVVTLSRISSTPGVQLVLTQTTNANGVFLFPAVLEGNYLMHVSRDGYSEFLNIYSNITIDEDTVLDHPIVMREAFGSVSGRVFNGTFMISNAQLTLLASDGSVFGRMITNSDGEYQFLNVPTGTYTLKVVRNGYEDAQATVVVSASEVSTSDFDLANIDRHYILGLDMPHSMMLVGIFLAACMVVVAMGFRMRVDKEPEILYLKAEEEEEESF
ncbi:MAG: carboxypeptidase regulatory-like domain-containing protein [Candidatus Methanomethylophilaceae archaeon]